MSFLDPGRWLLYGAFVITLILGIWRLDESRQQIGYNKAQAEQAVRDRAAEEKARDDETKWQDKIDKVSYDAQDKIDDLVHSLSASNGAADRLRDAARLAADKARKNTCAADSSTPTSDPAGVLAELLVKLDERAGVYAQAADRSRIAGAACVQAYEALTIK